MKIIKKPSRFREIDQSKQIYEISYAGSEIMTQMHDNVALPFHVIYVLVIKKLFCALHTYTGL